MLRILLIGRSGQLGWELQRCLAPLGEMVTYDYPEIDLGKPASLPSLVRGVNPQVIFNAAAYTNVDKAESEVELARQINAVAPGVLAEEAKRLNAAFIHYSTDYVFDGRKGAPYVESDAPHPLNVYGKTKLEGEQAIQAAGGAYLILRTSWVYSMRQGGFVSKVLQWSRQQEVLRVVDDQISGPTSARLLAEVTALILAQGRDDPVGYIREKAGLYHLAGSGACSRFEWAQAILELDPKKNEHKIRQLLPAKSSQFPTQAERPLVSVLECEKFEQAFGLRLPEWRGALQLAMDKR